MIRGDINAVSNYRPVGNKAAAAGRDLFEDVELREVSSQRHDCYTPYR